MNKLVKGSIAGAAGIALLLGGAGSLALWNDSASVAAGTVTSGVLDVTNATAGTWSPDIDLIVPGDTVTYTDTLELTATGDNLKATVTTNAGTITNDITGATVTTTVIVLDSSNTAVAPAAGIYTLGGGSYTVLVTVVVDFPSSVDEQTGQNASIDFDALEVTVTQVP